MVFISHNRVGVFRTIDNYDLELPSEVPLGLLDSLFTRIADYFVSYSYGILTIKGGHRKKFRRAILSWVDAHYPVVIDEYKSLDSSVLPALNAALKSIYRFKW